MSQSSADWSATHSRLRVELFLTSVVIFAVFYFDLSVGDTAPFGFKFGTKPSKDWIAIFLYGVFGYFLFALFLRTFTESVNGGSIGTDLRSLTAVLDHHMGQWISGVTPIFVIDDTELQRRLEEAAETFESQAVHLADSVNQDAFQMQLLLRSFPSSSTDLAKLEARVEQLERDYKASSELAVSQAPIFRNIVRSELNRAKGTLGFWNKEQRDGVENLEREIRDLVQRARLLSRSSGGWSVILDTERLLFGFVVPVISSVFLAAAPLLRLVVPDLSFS